MYSQSVKISGPNTLEVGIPANFTVTFTPNTDTSLQQVATKVSWSIPWLGANISGESNIYGFIKSTNDAFPYNFDTTGHNICTIPIQLGDFYNDISFDAISVIVTYNYKGPDGNTTSTTISGNMPIQYRRVSKPIFSLSSIQNCCTGSTTCTASGSQDANIFNWTISNGTILSGQGTNQLTFSPNVTGNVGLTCVASRSSAIAAYTRTTTQSITRTTPTVSINGDDFICKEQNKTYCISGFANLCGVDSILWTIPPSLTLVSGQGTDCITVIPKSTVQDGSTDTLSVFCSFSGGCTATNDQFFTVYSAGTPPTPSGSIYATYAPGASDCHGPYNISFQANNPYINGITTISPNPVYFEDDPIHGPRPKRITVCYVNRCSGIQTCSVYLLFPPAPCPPGDYLIGGQTVTPDTLFSVLENMSDSKRNEMELFDLQKRFLSSHNSYTLYPNPFHHFITLDMEVPSTGLVRLFDLNGHLILQNDFINSTQIILNPDGNLTPDVYVVTILTNQGYFTQKIIKK